jgi:hypothetical protein
MTGTSHAEPYFDRAGSGWVRALNIAWMVVEEAYFSSYAFETCEGEILYNRALNIDREIGRVLEMPESIHARRLDARTNID